MFATVRQGYLTISKFGNNFTFFFLDKHHQLTLFSPSSCAFTLVNYVGGFLSTVSETKAFAFKNAVTLFCFVVYWIGVLKRQLLGVMPNRKSYQPKKPLLKQATTRNKTQAIQFQSARTDFFLLLVWWVGTVERGTRGGKREFTDD